MTPEWEHEAELQRRRGDLAKLQTIYRDLEESFRTLTATIRALEEEEVLRPIPGRDYKRELLDLASQKEIVVEKIRKAKTV